MDLSELTLVQSILIPMVAAAIPVVLGVVIYGYQRALYRKQEFRRERRAVYSSFLKACPSPLDVYVTIVKFCRISARAIKKQVGPC